MFSSIFTTLTKTTLHCRALVNRLLDLLDVIRNKICISEFPESRFSSPDIESETRKVRNSSQIPSPILTRFEIRDRFQVRFRVISRETRNFESETPILPIKPVKNVPISSLKLEKLKLRVRVRFRDWVNLEHRDRVRVRDES